ncbi:MAG: hypothetical protein HY327_08405, partial [Chloroflexi bacterium]|nr:hypothetical protein [Chloroflexota bacterium]
ANLTILAPAYAFPAWLSETAAQNTPNRVEITYANQMKLIGYEIAPTRVTPGGSLQVTLYWQSLAPMNDDYSIGLNLLDTDQRVIASRASYPGHGLLPTRLWQPGQMLRDTYWMPAPAEVAAPTLAQLQVTLYSRADRRDLIAQDARGNAITPMVGRVRIAAPDNSQPAHATNYVFGNQISLIGYDLDAGKLVLYWQARTPLSTDYTVFVHWLNASGNVIAQRDQQPQNGNAPTALWESGEVIHDPYASDPAGARAVRIGLYRAETGERLVVVNGSGNSIGDSITVNLEGTR